MIRTDVQADTCPMIGSEEQSKAFAEQLVAACTEDVQKLRESNIFGKSLYDMVNDGLNGKIAALPEEFRYKMQNALTKIVNEGGKNLLCFVW